MSKKKQKKCIKCHYIADEKDQFCIKCGTPLVNKCGDLHGKYHKGCSFVNKEDAAYCAKCGYPTIFNQLGLLTPYVQSQAKPLFGRIHIT